jgi:hypothetical protein
MNMFCSSFQFKGYVFRKNIIRNNRKSKDNGKREREGKGVRKGEQN